MQLQFSQLFNENFQSMRGAAMCKLVEREMHPEQSR